MGWFSKSARLPKKRTKHPKVHIYLYHWAVQVDIGSYHIGAYDGTWDCIAASKIIDFSPLPRAVCHVSCVTMCLVAQALSKLG